MRTVRSSCAPSALCVVVGLGVSTAPTLGLQADQREQAASLEELTARVTPAVVLIDVTTAVDTRQGSGFLVDDTGRILTNYHVIRDARSARVRLSSGDVYEEVEVLAQDPRRDIAILQVAGFDLPYLELGNSDSVRVGAPVVLIGSPLGLENTVSTGIVSGRRQEPEGYQLLQISAPASRGSSGGAVLGTSGRVVGIASSQIGGGQNLNFAVPINYARGLLSHVGDEPLAVLRPTNVSSEPDVDARLSRTADRVNAGLSYRLDGFEGYRTEMLVDLQGTQRRRTRISYRLIESVVAGEPQIERYMESETTRVTEPFGTVQTLARERSRVVVRTSGLRPVSARGESSRWNGADWATSRYELRFQDGRVVGLLSDTTGLSVELDRPLPDGIVLRNISDFAFAVLDVDQLVGRSVEFTTFDSRTAEIDTERYDVLGRETIELDGNEYDVLRVNVAMGLDNEIYFVRAEAPRVRLRRISADGLEVEDVTLLETGPPSR
jgi:hypothetical protein